MGASESKTGRIKERHRGGPYFFSNIVARRRSSLGSTDGTYSNLRTILDMHNISSVEGPLPNSDNLSTHGEIKQAGGPTTEGTKNFKNKARHRPSIVSLSKFVKQVTLSRPKSQPIDEEHQGFNAAEVTRQTRNKGQRRKKDTCRVDEKQKAGCHEVTLSDTIAITETSIPPAKEHIEVQGAIAVNNRAETEEMPFPDSLFYERYKLHNAVLAFDKVTLSRDVQLADVINPENGKESQQVAVKLVPKIRKILGTEGTEGDNRKHSMLRREEIDEMRKKILKYSKLKHRNLPKFYGFYESKKEFIIVQEYIPRGNMCAMLLKASELYESGISECHLRSLMFSIFMAINYSHQKKEVALGSIDISNILLRNFNSTFGSREVIDKKKSMDSQGLPLTEGRHTFIPVLVGHRVNPVKITIKALLAMPEIDPALAFVAPEVLRSNCDDDRAADMYAFGVFVYCLFSGGYLPFQQHEGNPDALRRIVAGGADLKLEFEPPAAWRSISIEAKTMIRGLVEADPRLRSTAKELLSDAYFNKPTKQLQNGKINFAPMAGLLDKMGIRYDDLVVPRPSKDKIGLTTVPTTPLEPESRLPPVLHNLNDAPRAYNFEPIKIYDEPKDGFHLRSLLNSFDEDHDSQNLLFSEDFNSPTRFYREVDQRMTTGPETFARSGRSAGGMLPQVETDSLDDDSNEQL